MESSDDEITASPEDADESEVPSDAPASEPKEVRRRSTGVRGWRRKQSATMYLFIAWLIFAIIWLFFYAETYDIWQNIAIMLASFLLAGGLVAGLWSPRQWRIRLTITVGIGWIVFIILWLPFYAAGYSAYRNIAIFIISFLVMFTLIIGTWVTQGPGTVQPSGIRGKGMIAVFFGWLFVLVYWLWFYAESYTFENNMVVGLIVTLVAFLIMFGMLYSEIKDETDAPLLGPGLFIAWLLFLIVWFYMFAATLGVYQNFAVILVSFLVFLAIGIGYYKGRGMREIEAIDFTD